MRTPDARHGHIHESNLNVVRTCMPGNKGRYFLDPFYNLMSPGH
jgi:hypothetical protein